MTISKHKRYTLSLPVDVHDSLTGMADSRGVSSKDIILRALKLAAIADEVEAHPDKDLIIRDKSEGRVKETKIILV